MTTRQLVCIGKSLGYGALALTDHWTDAGFDEFFNIANPEGVDVIPGVEFDSKEFGVSFHITALDFDRNNPKIRKLIEDQVEARTECTRKCFERGIELGVVGAVGAEVTAGDLILDIALVGGACSAGAAPGAFEEAA